MYLQIAPRTQREDIHQEPGLRRDMYIYIYTCVHVCIYIYIYVRITCIYAYMYMYIHMYKCMYKIYIHVRMHVCMHGCMYVCMYACMYAPMHACMHTCTYVHAETVHTPPLSSATRLWPTRRRPSTRHSAGLRSSLEVLMEAPPARLLMI